MKKMINEKINYYLDWTCGISIDKLKKDLNELEKLGVTDIDIDQQDDYDDTIIFIEAYKNRKETDEEYHMRLQTEKKRLSSIKERELKQLKILTEKYKDE